MGNRLLTNPMLKTLRDNRGALIGWSITLPVFFMVVVGTYHATLGKDVPDRAAQVASMT
ncbi:MAG: hypothetical protein ACR2M0_05255 [Chloroflexia bacterium]